MPSGRRKPPHRDGLRRMGRAFGETFGRNCGRNKSVNGERGVKREGLGLSTSKIHREEINGAVVRNYKYACPQDR